MANTYYILIHIMRKRFSQDQCSSQSLYTLSQLRQQFIRRASRMSYQQQRWRSMFQSPSQYYQTLSPSIHVQQKERLVYREELKILKQLLHVSTQQFPCRSVGRIIGYQNNLPVIKATGILLSNNLVLTNARVIFNSNTKQFYPNLKFYLSPNHTMRVQEGIDIVDMKMNQILFKPGLTKSQRRNNDFALLKLAVSLDLQDKYFLKPTFLPCMSCFRDNCAYLKIVGYPRQCQVPVNSQGQEYKVFQCKNEEKNGVLSINQNENIFKYIAGTSSSNRGSPIFINNLFIGMHSETINLKDKKTYNQGIFFNQRVLNNLSRWAKQMGGNTFYSLIYTKCVHSWINLQYLLPSQQEKLRKIQYLHLSRSSIIQNCLMQQKFSLMYEGNGEKFIQWNDLLFKQCSHKNILQFQKIKERNLYIQQVSIDHINNPSTILFMKMKNLRWINLSKNHIRTIQLSLIAQLLELNLQSNLLTCINLMKNKKLSKLNLKNNLLQCIDVSSLDKLSVLNIQNNYLIEFDLFYNKSLGILYAGGNMLKYLNLKDHIHLTELSIQAGKVIKHLINRVYEEIDFQQKELEFKAELINKK